MVSSGKPAFLTFANDKMERQLAPQHWQSQKWHSISTRFACHPADKKGVRPARLGRGQAGSHRVQSGRQDCRQQQLVSTIRNAAESRRCHFAVC
jgi:hypothetical protein